MLNCQENNATLNGPRGLIFTMQNSDLKWP